LPGVGELFGPEAPCFRGGGEFGLTGDGRGFHKNCADVVVEAGNLVSVVVSVLQFEGAVTVWSGPAFVVGVAVGIVAAAAGKPGLLADAEPEDGDGARLRAADRFQVDPG
jgi:hypothetical protein